MNFQFKGEAVADREGDVEVENEYNLEIKIESLTLKNQPSDVQLIFIFGDLVNKLTVEKGEDFGERRQVYTVHSVPSALAEKLMQLPIMLYLVSLEDLTQLGQF